MELTYENMMEFVKEFFDGLPDITGPENKAMLKELYTPDFVCYVADLYTTGFASGELVTKSEIFDLERWLDHLTGHADIYRAKVIYEPYPLFIMIDERKMMGSMCITEQRLQPLAKQVMKEWYMLETVEFAQDKKGNVKFKRWFIGPYPDRFIEAESRVTQG